MFRLITRHLQGASHQDSNITKYDGQKWRLLCSIITTADSDQIVYIVIKMVQVLLQYSIKNTKH
jgi:hypothetical protein